MSRRLNDVTTLCISLFVALSLTGCCGTQRKLPDFVMPAVTLEEQVAAVNGLAHAVPKLAARGSVYISWKDDKGKHSESADASLRILQRYGPDALANHGPDIVLFGRVAGQEVFQVGKNPQKYWFLVRLDNKTAWVGDTAHATSVIDPRDPSTQRTPLRADVLTDLLGITEIAPTDVAVQRYNDDPYSPQVELLLLAKTPSGQQYIQRSIAIDRTTGHVAKITIFTIDGQPAITSILSDYRDAPYRDGNVYHAESVPPQLPYKAVITYTAQKASVELHFDDVSIPTKFPAILFDTPDFPAEGLKVVPAD